MEIKEKIAPIVEKYGVKLYRANLVKEEGALFFRIEVDGKVDLKLCEEISTDIGNYLDDNNLIKEDNYLLDVCSVGAERSINSKDEFKEALFKYIHIELNKDIDKQKIFEGYLINVDEDNIEMEILIKTRKKRYKFSYDDIKSSRYAINFKEIKK